MNKNVLTLFLFLFAALHSHAQITETATDAVKNMGLGWNLGNTFDANSGKSKDPSSDSYWNCQGLDSENCWGQPNTTKEFMTMMKEAGFGAIRVPVTWYNHMDKSGKVNAQWMKRVHEVVDYVIDNGMYCIINVHHDTGADNDSFLSWIKADETNYNNNKERYEYLWKQIAEEFKDYDKHLLFEGYNEMLDAQSTWNVPKNSNSYNAINKYAQSFVDAVRATGGNNETRNIIVNTYAAANDVPVQKLVIPTDKTSNHIIAEVHAYPNFFTWSSNPTLRTIQQVKSDVDYIYSNLKKYMIDKGIPAIIGEWGSFGVDNGPGKTDYDLRKDMFFEFCEYFVKKGKENNVATFYWMGLSDGMYRSRLVFNQADLAEKITKAFHGSDFKGKYPEMSKSSSIVCFEGEKSISWGDGIKIFANDIKIIGENVQLELTYDQKSGNDIQLYYGDWSKLVSFNVDGKTFNGDFIPSTYYKTAAGTKHTTVFTFSAATYKDLAVKGLIVHGTGITLKKAVIFDPSATGIHTISQKTNSDGNIYNLNGQRVKNAAKGIYIVNGKKIFRK